MYVLVSLVGQVLITRDVEMYDMMIRDVLLTGRDDVLEEASELLCATSGGEISKDPEYTVRVADPSVATETSSKTGDSARVSESMSTVPVRGRCERFEI